MEEWARMLKRKTDSGALLFFDRELWTRPKWRIDRDEISITCDCSTQVFWRRGEGSQAEAMHEVKGRLQVLKPA